MRELFPEIEPYDSGMLDVGGGDAVYWETCGNPDGVPALVVHGGPGSGCTPKARRWFDPAHYRIVLVDQRNCGRSRPHAGDPAVELTDNTTDRLIEDFEKVRDHLGVEQWLVRGWSWGATLGLAYSERHPERVSAIVLSAVTSTRRSEIDWLYRGVGRFFPEAWERFRATAGIEPAADIIARYAAMVEDPDPTVRAAAVAAWCEWEDSVLSGETGGASKPYGDRSDDAKVALVRICARYFSNGAWLPEGGLIDNVGRLDGIPGVLVHGRFDLGSPSHTAWALARGWSTSELQIVHAGGHLGNQQMNDLVLSALDRFATPAAQ